MASPGQPRTCLLHRKPLFAAHATAIPCRRLAGFNARRSVPWVGGTWQAFGMNESRRRVGRLEVPEVLFERAYAAGLLGDYLQMDAASRADRWMYSGAAFDRRPDDQGPGWSPDVIDESDLIALTYLSMPIYGHHALEILRYRRSEISRLLEQIPDGARIEDPGSGRLLSRGEAAWDLWLVLRHVGSELKHHSFGPVAAGKLLARKRPELIPISDSLVRATFDRPEPGTDTLWWDDVHAAALDADFWAYLTSLRQDVTAAAHLPALRVLDILAWMHSKTRGVASSG